MKHLYMYCIVMIFILISLPRISCGSQFIDQSEMTKEQSTANGCAAVACFLVVNSMRPELNVSLAAITKDLPFKKLCSATEIINTLSKYDLEVMAIKAVPTDTLPPVGSWNILLDTSKKPGHWFAVCHNYDNQIVYYGLNSPVDFKSGTFMNAFENMKKYEDQIIAINNNTYPAERRAVVLQIRKPTVYKPIKYITIGVFIVFVIGLYIIIKKKRVRYNALKTCIVFVVIISVNSWANSPKLEIDRKVVDLGTVKVDGRVTQPRAVVPFTIINKGNTDLLINSVKISCTCTSYVLSRKVLSPNVSTTLTITINIIHGEKRTVLVWVNSNDPVIPEFPLRIAYKSVPLYNIEPSSNIFHLNAEDRGSIITTPVDININKDMEDYFKPVRVEFDNGALAIRPKEPCVVSMDYSKDGIGPVLYMQYKYDVILDPYKWKPNESGASIRFVYDHGLVLVYNMTVSLIPPINIVPSRIIFTKPGQIKRLSITVRDNVIIDKNKKVNIRQINCAYNNILCEALGNAGNTYNIRVELRGAQKLNNNTIEMALDNVLKEYAKVSIPVEMIALNNSATCIDTGTTRTVSARLQKNTPLPDKKERVINMYDMNAKYGMTLEEALRKNKYVKNIKWQTIPCSGGLEIIQVTGDYDLTKSPNPTHCKEASFDLRFKDIGDDNYMLYGKGNVTITSDGNRNAVMVTTDNTREYAIRQLLPFTKTPTESEINAYEKSIKEIFAKDFEKTLNKIYKGDIF